MVPEPPVSPAPAARAPVRGRWLLLQPRLHALALALLMLALDVGPGAVRSCAAAGSAPAPALAPGREPAPHQKIWEQVRAFQEFQSVLKRKAQPEEDGSAQAASRPAGGAGLSPPWFCAGEPFAGAAAPTAMQR
jgi:hypothetical protein